MISLRDHGLMDAPAERAQLGVYGMPAFDGLGEAVVQGGIAGVEAVAGRVARMLMMADVEPVGSLAARVLTPNMLEMIGRSLIEEGESLHWLHTRGTPELLPAQRDWTVYGGIERASWVIDATLSGAMTIRAARAPRAGWLHIIREADPDYPWRGVPSISRARITYELAKVLEDALTREGMQPTAAIVPMPMGMKDAVIEQLRDRIRSRKGTLVMPETTQSGFGAGRTSAPQTDWKPHRLTVDPSSGLYIAAREAQARVISAMGAHPAIIGGATSTGTVDREARRQLREMLVEPIARLVEYEASSLFSLPVRLVFRRNPDTMMAEAKTAHIEAQTEQLRV